MTPLAYICAILAIALAAVTSFWRYEVHAFTAFKVMTEEQGKAAEAHAAAVKEQQDQETKEVSDGWAKALPAAQAVAVANYLAAHPAGRADGRPAGRGGPSGGDADRMRQRPGSGAVPSIAERAGGDHRADLGAAIPAAGGGSVAETCEPDAEFIQACARCVGQVNFVNRWVRTEKIPVKP